MESFRGAPKGRESWLMQWRSILSGSVHEVLGFGVLMKRSRGSEFCDHLLCKETPCSSALCHLILHQPSRLQGRKSRRQN